ncbi:hypothetical protein, partial [uncultured Faecalibaculum sp.]|uniref:hypothetical protein n=1 Tax=uncultured Faecalibaculum sp. TaxID=1729681 RepID=UPI0027120563
PCRWGCALTGHQGDEDIGKSAEAVQPAVSFSCSTAMSGSKAWQPIQILLTHPLKPVILIIQMHCDRTCHKGLDECRRIKSSFC